MSPPGDKPEDPGTAYGHLVELCSHGMLYEAEEWLDSGHSAARPEEARHCVLTIACERGFHSLVRVLLRHDCTEEQKFRGLQAAAKSGDLGIARLLVEAGAPVERLPFWCLDEIVNRPLIEYLLDHGLDLTRADGLAQMLTCRRIKPLLGLFLQNRARFPEWEEQAAKALCEFISANDRKWISLMVWAGTDPLLKVHPMSETPEEHTDDDMRDSAAELALRQRDPEIFEMLKLQLTPEQADGLMRDLWFSPSRRVLELLLDAGADVNRYDREEGSLLHRALISFGFSFDSCLPSREPRQEVETIAWLIRRGARWRPPEEDGGLDSLRRQLYRGEGELVIEVVRLLDAGEACDKDLLREFVGKPKMRGWLKVHEPALAKRLLG